MEIVDSTFAGCYNQLRQVFLSDQAQLVSPRGKATKELLNVNICIDNPRSRLGYHPLRKFSLAYAVAEAILLFDQSSRIKYVQYINPKIIEYSDDGVTFNSAYGARIADYIPDVLDLLINDKDTRRAVLPIIRQNDIITVSKDIPCTSTLQFIIRDDKLNMFTTMRSNDTFIGWFYDTFQFTCLQEILANELNLELGSYFHRVASMHYYLSDEEKLKTVDTLEPIEFEIPYTLNSIYPLVQIVKKLDREVPEGYEKLGPFAEVLRRFALKKRGLIVKVPLHNDMLWAEPYYKSNT